MSIIWVTSLAHLEKRPCKQCYKDAWYDHVLDNVVLVILLFKTVSSRLVLRKKACPLGKSLASWNMHF